MEKKKFCFKVIILTAVFYIAAMFSVLLSDGASMKYLIWQGGTAGVFPDLMQTVFESKGFHPYESGGSAIYPPLTYLICSVLAYSIPGMLDFNSSLTPHGILVLTLFFVVTSCVVSILVYDSMKLERGSKMLMVLAFLFSAPALYMFERGNTVLLSVAFCCYFVLYYDSESKRKREAAYICLAIAASLKLYPALLGMLLWADRKYKESVRCCLYGAGIFALPVFFEGGFGELKGMLEGIRYFQTETILDERNFGYGFKVNITNWVYAIGEYFHMEQDRLARINSILLAVSLLMLLCTMFMAGLKWQRVTAGLLALVLIPTFSWIYNVCYLLGGCILFANYLCETEAVTIKNVIYAGLFMAMFVPLPYGEVFTSLHGVNKISLSTAAASVSMLLMAGLLFADGLSAQKRRKNIEYTNFRSKRLSGE